MLGVIETFKKETIQAKNRMEKTMKLKICMYYYNTERWENICYEITCKKTGEKPGISLKGGGGKKEMAQAGGKNSKGVIVAFDKIEEMLRD